MDRAFVITVLTFASFTSAAQAQGGAANSFLMKKYTIRDVERNNSQPLSTILFPAGWQAESRVQWTLASSTIPFAVGARFTSPQGTTAVEFFPIPQGVRNVSPVKVEGELPQDVIAALTKLAQSQRPQNGFRVVSHKANKQTKTAEQGPGMANFAQTGIIRVVYVDKGKDFEEEFAGTLHVMYNAAIQGYSSYFGKT
jgi:hypothetical protein